MIPLRVPSRGGVLQGMARSNFLFGLQVLGWLCGLRRVRRLCRGRLGRR